MKAKVLRVVAYLLAGFILMFLGRWALLAHRATPPDEMTNIDSYFDAYNTAPPQPPNYPDDDDGDKPTATITASYGYARKMNLAREVPKGMAFQATQIGASAPVGQTYEKTGTLGMVTRAFTQDEKTLRGVIATTGSQVQYENSTGLEGKRVLALVLGVEPAKFDGAVADLRKIGKLSIIRVDKKDKTNDYLALVAQKASITKTMKALEALKGRSGKIDELVKLENRIHNLEAQAQGLGIQIGQFEGGRDLCTVKTVLLEIGPGVSCWALALPALDWAFGNFALALGLLFVCVCAAFLLVVLIAKIEDLPAILKK